MTPTPVKRSLRRLMIFASITLSSAIVITLTVLSYMQGRWLATPLRLSLSASPDDIGIHNWRDVTFTTSDGLSLSGWYVPPAASDGAALLFVHGHANNRTEFINEMALFHQQGYGVLVFDLRNSGISDGTSTSMGDHEVKDVIAAFEFLAAQPEVDAARIGIYGHSMGAATSILAMPRIPQARALAVSAPYADVVQVFGEGVKRATGLPPFPFGQMIAFFTGVVADGNLFEVRPVDVVAAIAPRPVMFIHGTADSVVPFHHSQRLYAAAGEPKYFYAVENGQHSGYKQADPHYPERILAFFQQYLSQ